VAQNVRIMVQLSVSWAFLNNPIVDPKFAMKGLVLLVCEGRKERGWQLKT